MVIAAEMGYLAQLGVKYEFVKTGEASVHELIATGKLDASVGMLPNTVLFLDQGVDFRVALGNHTGCLQIVVPKNSDINDVADLRGKKIGVPGMGSSGRIFAQRVLLSAGVGATADNLEVEFLAFTGSELAMALENKLVDAISCNDPNASKIVASGLGRTLIANASDPRYKDEYCCVTVMGSKFVEEHPVAAERLVKALKMAGEYIEAHPEETAKIQIEKGFLPDANQLDLYVSCHKSYSYASSVEGGRIGLRNNAEDLKRIGMIRADFDIDRVIDNVYIEFKNLDN
jgi:NitT/TauT family transport system substrate-binding protein